VALSTFSANSYSSQGGKRYRYPGFTFRGQLLWRLIAARAHRLYRYDARTHGGVVGGTGYGSGDGDATACKCNATRWSKRKRQRVNNPTAVASRTRPPLPPCGRAPRHVRDGMHPPRPPVLRARANGTDGSPAAAAAAFGTVSGASAQWQTGRHRPVAGWSCWSGPRRRVGLPRWDRWPY
jgi:hypothetical protein